MRAVLPAMRAGRQGKVGAGDTARATRDRRPIRRGQHRRRLILARRQWILRVGRCGQRIRRRRALRIVEEGILDMGI